MIEDFQDSEEIDAETPKPVGVQIIGGPNFIKGQKQLKNEKKPQFISTGWEDNQESSSPSPNKEVDVEIQALKDAAKKVVNGQKRIMHGH